jgi:hypothetical protein
MCACFDQWWPSGLAHYVAPTTAVTTTATAAAASLSSNITVAHGGGRLTETPSSAGAAPQVPLIELQCRACPSQFRATDCAACAPGAAGVYPFECAFKYFAVSNWTMPGACDVFGPDANEAITVRWSDGTVTEVHLNMSSWPEYWTGLQQDLIAHVLGSSSSSVGSAERGFLAGGAPCAAIASQNATLLASLSGSPPAWSAIHHAAIATAFLNVTRDPITDVVINVTRSLLVEFQVNASSPDVAEQTAACLLASLPPAGPRAPSIPLTNALAALTRIVLREVASSGGGARVVATEAPVSCRTAEGFGSNRLSAVPACQTVFGATTPAAPAALNSSFASSPLFLKQVATGCPILNVSQFSALLAAPPNAAGLSGGGGAPWWIYAAAGAGALLIIAAIVAAIMRRPKLAARVQDVLAFRDATKYNKRFDIFDEDMELKLMSDQREITFEDI